MLTHVQTIYVALSFILGSVFFYRAVTRRSWQSLAHTVIVSWSGMIYLTQVTIAGSQGLAYYADWIVTTPLIVLSLGYTIHDKLNGEVMIASTTQLLTIFSAVVYAKNPTGTTLLISSLFFFSLTVYWLYKWLQTEEKVVLSWITLLTWFAYPLVYYAYDGMLGEATTALVILPLLSKHVFTSLKEFYY